MKGLLKCLSFVAILVVVWGPMQTDAMYNNICRLFPDGSKFQDPYACDAYVTCINSTEVSTKCPKNQIFSITSKKCVKSEEGCADPCAPDFDNVWFANPKSCSGYYFCSNGVGTIGSCSSGLHFNEDAQECVFPTDSECKGDSFCEIIPNGMKFKDESTCEKYRVCEKNKLKSKKCPAGQWFDRVVGSCALKSQVTSCDLMPEKVCMKGIKVEKDKCVSDKASCRGYYYCRDQGKTPDEDPEWHQCDEGLFFNYKSQACSDPLTVTCNDDRCDGRGDLFVNSDTDCQHYLVCKNGVTVDERKCSEERFFDEKRQACTSEVIEYKICS